MADSAFPSVLHAGAPVGECGNGSCAVWPSHPRRSCSLCPSSQSRRPQTLGGCHRVHARLCVDQKPLTFCFGWKRRLLINFAFFLTRRRTQMFDWTFIFICFVGLFSGIFVWLVRCLVDFMVWPIWTRVACPPLHVNFNFHRYKSATNRLDVSGRGPLSSEGSRLIMNISPTELLWTFPTTCREWSAPWAAVCSRPRPAGTRAIARRAAGRRVARAGR